MSANKQKKYGDDFIRYRRDILNKDLNNSLQSLQYLTVDNLQAELKKKNIEIENQKQTIQRLEEELALCNSRNHNVPNVLNVPNVPDIPDVPESSYTQTMWQPTAPVYTESIVSDTSSMPSTSSAPSTLSRPFIPFIPERRSSAISTMTSNSLRDSSAMYTTPRIIFQ